MLILHKEDHGCAYTLGEDYELFYSPIYTDNTINLNEFHPVDLADYDDVNEIEDIQSQLITASPYVRYWVYFSPLSHLNSYAHKHRLSITTQLRYIS